MILYHATTEKMARAYHDSGRINRPVRGFDTLYGAMAWGLKTGRKVIYQVAGEPGYKLPDHHNQFGEAWWLDMDVPIKNVVCVFSADTDA